VKKNVAGPVALAEFVFINRSEVQMPSVQLTRLRACAHVIIIRPAKTYNLHDGGERRGSYIILI